MSTFRYIEIEQGTARWHEWRAGGVGSSEVAAIMGISPHRTADDVLSSKLGVVVEDETNPAMIRGTRLEPIARQAFEEAVGIYASPCCVERQDNPILRASLDGLDLEGIPVEIKAPGLETHADALRGVVPAYWLVQVRYILEVTGAPFAYFVSYHDGHEPALAAVRVDADPEHQAKIVDAVLAFWRRVERLRSGQTDFEPGAQHQQVAINAATVGNEAAELTIVDDETYKAGGSFLIEIATRRKELERIRDHLLAPVKEAKRRIDDFIGAPLAALTGAETTLRGRMADYRAKREAEATEARRKALEEAEARAAQERAAALEAERAAREAAAAAKTEAEIAQAARALAASQDAVRVASVVRPMAAPVQAPPKVAGIGSRMNWSAECTDLRALLAAALEKPELLAFVQVNGQALNAHARAVKDAFAVPGCRVISQAAAIVRTSK